MLGKFLRQPGANEVTLETAGLILGTSKLKSAENGGLLSESAGKQARKIEQVLSGNGGLLDNHVRAFLTNAHRAFSQLETMPGAIVHSGSFGHAAMTGYAGTYKTPNPEWAAKLDELKGALQEEAGLVQKRVTEQSTATDWNIDTPAPTGMARLFSAFLRRPDGNTLALETAGYILGEKKLVKNFDGSDGDLAASRMAEKIGKVLKDSGDTMDPSARHFLGLARNSFLYLAESKSSQPTGESAGYGEGLVAVHKPDPAWTRKLEHVQQSLATHAEALVARVKAEPADVVGQLRADADKPVVGGMRL
ncbi:MAG: hypothetical protein KI792_08120 [Alphaproteobacteria bacterium]|nr:hypothetical protein [Alphaproteobacteria bacterium SS10]